MSKLMKRRTEIMLASSYILILLFFGVFQYLCKSNVGVSEMEVLNMYPRLKLGFLIPSASILILSIMLMTKEDK